MLVEGHRVLQKKDGRVVEEGTLLETWMAVDGYYGHFMVGEGFFVGPNSQFSQPHSQVSWIQSMNAVEGGDNSFIGDEGTTAHHGAVSV